MPKGPRGEKRARAAFEFVALVLLALIVGVAVGDYVGDDGQFGGLIGMITGVGAAALRATRKSNA